MTTDFFNVQHLFFLLKITKRPECRLLPKQVIELFTQKNKSPELSICSVDVLKVKLLLDLIVSGNI